MALTHVCVWDPQIGYRRITTEEASELFPYGASARSGHFVCELCTQNVGLSKARIDTGTRYFFHNSAEQDKECEDRQKQTDRADQQRLSSLSNHAMPLRIALLGSAIRFELGFVRPPDSGEHCKTIRISGTSHEVFEHNFEERIEQFGTSFLNVGETPSPVYGIEYIQATSGLSNYWGNTAAGVRTAGSLFDYNTRLMLQVGGKAFSRNKYYLLLRQRLYNRPTDIDAREITKVQTKRFATWYLYEIRVNRFSEAASKFFLQYSIFLTEKPTKYYPIWPPYIQDPYFIYHDSDDIYLYLCGDDATLKAFPNNPNKLFTGEGRVYRLHSRGREQLVSLGKSGALGFSYLIRQSLVREAPLPEIQIKDLAGEELTEEQYSKLPKGKQISVLPQYDGKAVIKKKGKTVYIYKLSADESLLIDALSLGTEILFYQGCDCVKTVRFEAESTSRNVQLLDETLVRQLSSCTGPKVPVTHRIGALAGKYEAYPQTKQWLRTAIRSGTISRKALRILTESIPNTKGRENGDG